MAVDNGTNETNDLADHPDQSEFQESQDIFGGLPTTLHEWPQKEHKDDGEKNKSEERTDKDISNDDDWMFIFNTGWQTPPEPDCLVIQKKLKIIMVVIVYVKNI
ncbi:hypothetical protein O0L34_g8723 [Tuta absoluta]|nr:hypothetical protein O0L34_g8723 [Tuta absoluta]